MKLSTVNVIEFADQMSSILSLQSYSDDADGNKEAEARFKACMLENGGGKNDVDGSEDAEAIEDATEDGYFENGSYTLMLTHSTE